MTTETLIQSLIEEVKGLRADVRAASLTTCSSDEAAELLGLGKWALTRLSQMGVLHPYGGGKGGYRYHRSEIFGLLDKIKTGSVKLPKKNP